MAAPAHLSPADDALTWAQQYLPNTQSSVITALPWESSYRVYDAQQAACLRSFPSADQHSINNILSLAKYFPQQTPSIIASSPESNAVLLERNSLINLGNTPSDTQRQRLLHTYASLQAEALQQAGLLNALPHLNTDLLLLEVLDFLNPATDSKTGVNASYFMPDAREAQGYHAALSHRAELIQTVLSQAKRLPATLNHCQLYNHNAFENYQGQVLIDHWEAACIGPAGLSLSQLFNSCTYIKQALHHDKSSQDKHLFTYLRHLAEQHYTDLPTLVECLPAAAFAGVMQRLLQFAHKPLDEFDYKKYVNQQIRDAVEDLVHYCDQLVIHGDREQLLHYSQDYVANGAPWRGATLLDAYLVEHPSDIELRHRLTDLHLSMGNWQDAIVTAQEILQMANDSPTAHHMLAIAYMKNCQPELAIREFEITASLAPDMPEVQANIEKCSQLIYWQDRARVPHLAPTLALTDQEREQQQVPSEKLDLAINMFKEHGYTVIQNAFDKQRVQNISQQVFGKYDSYFEDRYYSDNLVLGDKRRMVTLDVEGEINHPSIYGSHIIDTMMSALLDNNYVLGGVNAVVSLPGSKNQGLHKDYAPLFPNDDEKYFVTPPFAIAVLIPLINMTHAHGVTSFRKGSHLVPEQMPFHMPTQDPLLQLGDCVVFDYRTAHEGLANHTSAVRPMLSLIYHRIWFRDAMNYEQQTPVSIAKTELAKVPEAMKHLFKWVEAC